MALSISISDDILGGKSWGDYQYEHDMARSLDRVLPSDWDLEFPILSLRKDIWTHFPVILMPLGTGSDGAERHAVMWHRKRLVAWRESRSADFQEWSDYEAITEYRLLKCLRASARWVVEPAQTDAHICVIRMLYGDQAPELTIVQRVAQEHIPVLTCLNDIKLYFPVVWHKLSDNSNAKLYSIELYEKKIVGDRAEVVQKLEKALRASGSWRVLRAAPGSKEICRLEM